MLLASISRQAPLPPSLLVLSIRSTPLNKVARRERIFAMAFLTLQPIGQADFNTVQERKVDLNTYTRHIICYYDKRFRQYPHQRFLIFNLLIRQKAGNSARFYVSKTLGLKDLTCEELIEALQTDESLFPQIVQQGSMLTSIWPFQRNKRTSLQA